MNDENRELRDRILLASLPHVVFEGWSDAALAAGVKDLGDVPKTPEERAFPGGISDMAVHFSDWADRRMADEMAGLDLEPMKVRQRIAAALRHRLEVLSPHREAVRLCLGYLALPRHAGLSLKCGAATVNRIWTAAGDESDGFGFYSRRVMLAPVLASSVLYWLADEAGEDGDFPETWAFIDRRMDNLMNLFQRPKLCRIPSPLAFCKRFSAAVQARG